MTYLILKSDDRVFHYIHTNSKSLFCASNKLYILGLLLLVVFFTVVAVPGDFAPAYLSFPAIFCHFEKRGSPGSWSVPTRSLENLATCCLRTGSQKNLKWIQLIHTCLRYKSTKYKINSHKTSSVLINIL